MIASKTFHQKVDNSRPKRKSKTVFMFLHKKKKKKRILEKNLGKTQCPGFDLL